MQRFFTELRLFLNVTMDKFLLLIPALWVSLALQAQSYDSWEIYQNRKEVSKFNNKKETSDERKVLLLNRFLEGPGFFVIEYKPAAEQAEWIRTIAFYDSTDKQIRQYDNTLLLRMHNSEIAGIMDGRQKVRVYSWAVPKDPAVAATVRVRRQLLCTLYTR
jgi:hypothetical protein